jgi:uncharacterized membrane protein YozB (DUF420 family)
MPQTLVEPIATAVRSTGLLPTRGSLMLDVVFLATFAIVAFLAISIYVVRRRQYRLHSRIQLTLAIVLIVAITAFEIDLRFFTDWRSLARHSPYYESGWVDRWLAIHLCFAIPTPLIWIAAIGLAVRWFGWDPRPNLHSLKHRRIGWLAAGAMAMTMATGWVFYYVAFVA